MKNRSRIALSMTVSLLVLAACGDDATTTTMDDHLHDDETTFAFGEPGHADEADRVIELVTNDVLRFEPDSFEVSLGETVTFRVTNDGLAAHDFTLGDQAAQEEHAAMMAEMSGMHMADEPNAIVLEVGETKELTWTFSVAGEVLIGCHQPGHYEAGMSATITVTG